MGHIPKAYKFKIILKLSHKFDVEILCGLAEVSTTGYYDYKRKVVSKQTKEDKERLDAKIVNIYVTKSRRRKGYRMITMILHRNGIFFNHKKVLRLMNKYDMLAIIRKKDPYNKIRKATQEHNTAKNILNREFRGLKPYSKIGTDITYVRFKGKWVYLSIMKDMITGEILSHVISTNLELGFVQETLKGLENLNIKGALIHSDQGFHYTHPSFKLGVERLGCIQSMSRRGNCIDNSPTETFFGHMKDNIDLTGCETFEDVIIYMKYYIHDYNNNRPQWNRKKMTPVEYRNHLLNN